MGAEAPARASPEQRERAGESEATRYLCVGAQIDDDFADRVIREVLEERYRAVAPSTGVVRHRPSRSARVAGPSARGAAPAPFVHGRLGDAPVGPVHRAQPPRPDPPPRRSP